MPTSSRKPPYKVPQLSSSLTYAGLARCGAIVILPLAALAEFCISASETNIASTIMALSSALMGCLYVFRGEMFRRFPTSSIALFGIIMSTLAGPLVAQACAWHPLDYNLQVPLKTFGVCSAVLIVCLVAHFVYAKSALGQGLRIAISRTIVARLGLLAPPSEAHLWALGVLGIVATLIAGLAVKAGDGVGFGDVQGKIWQGLMPFALAPFLIPFTHLLFASRSKPSRQSRVMLIGYLLLLISVALLRNSRDFFAQAFVTLTLGTLVVTIGGLVKPNRAHVKVALIASVLIVPTLIVLSYLGLAMSAARDIRGSVSPMQLAKETLEIVKNPERMQKKKESYVQAADGYNEVYINNVFVNRLITTKYIDNNLFEASNLSGQDESRATDFMKSALILTVPTPVLQALKIDIRKEDYQYSGGDLYGNLASVSRLGGFRTGSSMADGLAVFGPLYWPILFLICFFASCYLDALSVSERGVLVLSPLVLFMAERIFFGGLMGENMAGLFAFYIRGIPQMAGLYAITRVLFLPLGKARPDPESASLQKRRNASRAFVQPAKQRSPLKLGADSGR